MCHRIRVWKKTPIYLPYAYSWIAYSFCFLIRGEEFRRTREEWKDYCEGKCSDRFWIENKILLIFGTYVFDRYNSPMRHVLVFIRFFRLWADKYATVTSAMLQNSQISEHSCITNAFIITKEFQSSVVKLDFIIF